jgi:SAM-dependent methyltransferase
MSTGEIFGPLHANWYDRWHGTKDYRAEVDQLIAVIRRAAPAGRLGSIVDLGCGTGRHLELLAEAGSEVVGVDRSAVMVARAKERLARFGPRASVVEGDLTELRLDRGFDALTMMFSVFGYHTGNDELLAVLAVAHRHLHPGGLLLFDVLDAATVLREGPRGGVTVVNDGTRQLLRATTGSLDIDQQVYQLGIRLWLLDGDRVAERAEESHRLRFFLPRELELLLRVGGFRLLGSAPLAGGQPGPSREWLRLVWARRD